MRTLSYAIQGSLTQVPKDEMERTILERDLGLATSIYTNRGRKAGERKLFFLEDELHYYLPRNYLAEKRIPVREWQEERMIGDPINASFTKTLRDYQKDFIALHQEALQENDDIIVEASCGSGKTVLSLYLLAQRRRKTIVLVPTNYLASQYFSRAKEFISGVNVVWAQAKDKKIAWQEADILICSYDLFASREFPEDFYYHFGHLVIDEGHRMGADTHEQTTSRFHTKYRTMLTATFRREDGGEKILRYHFGISLKMDRVNPDVIVKPARTGIRVGELVSLKNLGPGKYQLWLDTLEKLGAKHGIYYRIVGDILEVNYHDDHWERIKVMDFSLSKAEKAVVSRIVGVAKNYTKNPQYASLDSFLARLKDRNGKITSLTMDCLREKRKVLILGKRKEQLYLLERRLQALGVKTLVIVSETLKKLQKEDRVDEATQGAQVVLGIDKLAKEGMDVDTLDTLLLIHPVGDVEQAMGRIARILPNKKTPTMYYLVDDTRPHKLVFKKSTRFIPLAGRLEEPINI